MKLNRSLLMAGILSAALGAAPAVLANADTSPVTKEVSPSSLVNDLCHKIGTKLSSVSEKECRKVGFNVPRFYSVNGLPIVEKHFPADSSQAPRILFIGGIHGDEYSSVSVTFKWLNTLLEHHSGSYDWHFVPLANPDGLLKKRSTRVNANDVDLNRNFTPAEGFADPLAHWQERAKRRARYYPGKAPLSEPETQAIHQLIDEYKPTVIVSVHAPHGILDFDGNSIQPPSRLGPLYLKQLGTYPGSLGNYAWFVKKIPVMTIELKHAGIMPKANEISRMWVDLVRWVDKKTKQQVDIAKGDDKKEKAAPTQ
jgi:protein MpaA